MHMNRKKNLSFLKRKVLESIQVNFQERKVLRPLSQIFFKKYEIDFENKGCIVYKGNKMRLIFF